MPRIGNPEPDAFDINGQPLYTAETMARCSGIPLNKIKKHCHEYERMFGKVEPDPKVTVLKQPEVFFQVTAIDLVWLALGEWTDKNPTAVAMLEGWFTLAIERGLKPIVVHQLKALVVMPIGIETK